MSNGKPCGQRQGNLVAEDDSGKLCRVRQAFSRSSGKETSVTANGKFVVARQRKVPLRQTVRANLLRHGEATSVTAYGKGKSFAAEDKELRSNNKGKTSSRIRQALSRSSGKENFRRGKRQRQTCRGRRQTSLVNDKWQFVVVRQTNDPRQIPVCCGLRSGGHTASHK